MRVVFLHCSTVYWKMHVDVNPLCIIVSVLYFTFNFLAAGF